MPAKKYIDFACKKKKKKKRVYFSVVRLDENPVTFSTSEKKRKRLKDFKFRTFIGRFQVASWQRKG